MVKKFKDFVWNIIACGLPKDYDPEVLRKMMLLNLVSISGILILIPVGLLALMSEHLPLFIADCLIWSFLIFNLLWLRKTKNSKWPGYIGVIVTTVFFLFLIVNGGVKQSSYLWSFTYPMFSIFILGIRKGGYFSIFYLINAIIIFSLGNYFDFISVYSSDIIIRFIAVFIIVLLFALIMEITRERVHKTFLTANFQLQETLEEVKSLSGLLPICSHCKKIRDDDGYWNQIEGYIQKHSEAKFSHSMCPQCTDEFYKDENWYQNMKIRKSQVE